MDAGICPNDGSQATYCIAVNRITAAYVNHTGIHGVRHRCTLEANRPQCARRVKVENVENITEIEPRCLHLQLDLSAGNFGQFDKVVLSNDEVIDRARSCEVELV